MFLHDIVALSRKTESPAPRAPSRSITRNSVVNFYFLVSCLKVNMAFTRGLCQRYWHGRWTAAKYDGLPGMLPCESAFADYDETSFLGHNS